MNNENRLCHHFCRVECLDRMLSFACLLTLLLSKNKHQYGIVVNEGPGKKLHRAATGPTSL